MSYEGWLVIKNGLPKKKKKKEYEKSNGTP